MFRTPLALFRAVAIAEMVSWTLLLGGLLIRALTGFAPAVSVGGGIHGFVFLAYAATAVLVAKNQRWSAGATVLAVVSAVIPYATVPVERRFARRGLLSGSWRRHAGDDPRDGAWHDAVLRFVLARPVLSVVGALVAVTAVFAALLVVGPPVGKA